jgi:hypothetical protein
MQLQNLQCPPGPEQPFDTLVDFCMVAFERRLLLRRMAELLYTAAKHMRVVHSPSVHSRAAAEQT